jgi:hypothetical protein
MRLWARKLLLGGGFDLGAGKLGADFGLNYLLRGKGQASRFI